MAKENIIEGAIKKHKAKKAKEYYEVYHTKHKDEGAFEEEGPQGPGNRRVYGYRQNAHRAYNNLKKKYKGKGTMGILINANKNGGEGQVVHRFGKQSGEYDPHGQ